MMVALATNVTRAFLRGAVFWAALFLSETPSTVLCTFKGALLSAAATKIIKLITCKNGIAVLNHRILTMIDDRKITLI